MTTYEKHPTPLPFETAGICDAFTKYVAGLLHYSCRYINSCAEPPKQVSHNGYSH
jgi:hypothetical protein